MKKTVRIIIDGMECINCQNRIEKALRSTKGVIKARVSYSKGVADIEYDDEKVKEDKLVKVIEKLDYKVLSQEGQVAPGILKTLGLLVIIGALYYLLQAFGILNRLAPDRLAESGMGYGMLFVIGLVTSIHCVAMCGGIGLSQSLPTNGNDGEGIRTFLRPLSYNLGRICSYTLIGLLLGSIGAIFGGGMGLNIPALLQGIFKIIVGLIMVVMGINMLGIFPWLRKFSIHTPMAIVKFIGGKRREAKGAFTVGLLNGLMPCGPLQAMWIVALATGSPLSGALSMFMFSLGTVPLMLGLGSAVSLLGRKFTSQVIKAGAVLVVVMGLAMLTQGGILSGLMSGSISGSKAFDERDEEQVLPEETPDVISYGQEIDTEKEIEDTGINDEVQIINSTLTPGKYPDITVHAGVPVRWTIDAPEESLTGCNAVMQIPDYNIQYAFDPGENVIEFTPEKTGTVTYSCWMGMIYGSIEVVD